MAVPLILIQQNRLSGDNPEVFMQQWLSLVGSIVKKVFTREYYVS
jgi:hypothetical protein